MITREDRARLPGPGWNLRYTPERKQFIVTAPDGTSNLFDTVDQAIAWASDSEAVEAKRKNEADIATQRKRQELKRESLTANRSIPAPGWSVTERRATGTWIAARGAHREEFDTEEEAIAFTHE